MVVFQTIAKHVTNLFNATSRKSSAHILDMGAAASVTRGGGVGEKDNDGYYPR